MVVRYGVLFLLFLVLSCPIAAQELNVPEVTVLPDWKATWITHPGISGNEHASVLFRKVITLPSKPGKFIISISADNKYTLYVNGTRVVSGPQLSDIRHWRYETIDIAAYLTAGANLVAAEVVNFGPDRFFGQQSYRTALIVNGNAAEPASIDASVVNTVGGQGWETHLNASFHEKKVRWRSAPRDIIGGFYANNPTDSVTGHQYPWGWHSNPGADIVWMPAVFCESAAAFGGGFGWLLEPRNTPLQQRQVEKLTKVVSVSGGALDDGFLGGEKPYTVPPGSKLSFLIDHRVLTTGFPELHYSGGRDAEIRIGYAENLFIPNTANKGNRNEWEGKQFLGITDVVIADGGTGRIFTPSWLRTFRFIKVDVVTHDQPLVLQRLFNWRTHSSVPITASFASSNPLHASIFDICRRTVEVSTQDYFLSDAYYETMQYVGDTKVHGLVWQVMTGNDLHFRNALEQFHYSRLWDGNLTSCYPLKSTFVHPTYSVIWVDMLYDYLLYTGDRAFIGKFVPGIRQTLSMFDALISAEGIAGPTRWNYFVDWYQFSTRGGLAPGQDGSNSAVVTLHYVYALQHAARMFQYLGLADEAAAYAKRADWIKGKVREQCFDPATRMFAERPDKSYFDQHTNIMAVLTDALPAGEQADLLRRILADPKLGQATYYYRFYLFEAIRKTGAVALFDEAVAPWKELIDMGLTTTLERLESPSKPTRSECHPWSAGPAYAFYTLLAGIHPDDFGFEKITMKPNLLDLEFIEGRYPHPKGVISFRFERTRKGTVANIELPAGVGGTCLLNGRTYTLAGGKQSLKP